MILTTNMRNNPYMLNCIATLDLTCVHHVHIYIYNILLLTIKSLQILNIRCPANQTTIITVLPNVRNCTIVKL